MADYKLTPLEKETIILWNEEEDKVCIDTFNSKLISRLKKAKKDYPEHYRVDSPDIYGGVYAEIPKELFWVALSSPLSEEERRKRADRMKEQRQKRIPSQDFDDE